MGGRCRDLGRWEGGVCRECGLVEGIVTEASLCFVFSWKVTNPQVIVTYKLCHFRDTEFEVVTT